MAFSLEQILEAHAAETDSPNGFGRQMDIRAPGTMMVDSLGESMPVPSALRQRRRPRKVTLRDSDGNPVTRTVRGAINPHTGRRPLEVTEVEVMQKGEGTPEFLNRIASSGELLTHLAQPTHLINKRYTE